MNAHTFTPTTFAIPISSGLLAHCQKIGIAIWVFLWMIDRTTKEVATTDGYAEGLVYGGKAIRAYDIGLDLDMPSRTIQAHLDRLVAQGYLRRINRTQGVASGYAVQRSKKWKPKLSVAGPEEQEATPPILAPSPQNPAKGAPFLAKTPQNPATTPPFSAPYIEDITRTLQGLNNVDKKALEALEPNSSSSSTHESSFSTGKVTLPVRSSSTDGTPPPSSAAPPAPRPPGDLARAIEIWNQNCGDSLTKVRAGSTKRREKLKTRIGEAHDPETYFAELEQVVKLCATTPFLLGKNDQGWTPDFDWLMKNDENLGKVLEGKYGKPYPVTSTSPPVNYVDPFARPEYADDYVPGGESCGS